MSERLRRLALPALVLAVVGSGLLTGCSSDGCGTGDRDPASAVHDLVEASKAGKTPQEACRWITNGYSPSRADMSKLAKEFGKPIDDYRFVADRSSLMGSVITVVAYSTSGSTVATFTSIGENAHSWTVAFGKLSSS